MGPPSQAIRDERVRIAITTSPNRLRGGCLSAQLHTRTAASTVDFGEVVPLTADPLIALDNAVVLSCT